MEHKAKRKRIQKHVKEGYTPKDKPRARKYRPPAKLVEAMEDRKLDRIKRRLQGQMDYFNSEMAKHFGHARISNFDKK
jgi:hypothetical protein